MDARVFIAGLIVGLIAGLALGGRLARARARGGAEAASRPPAASLAPALVSTVDDRAEPAPAGPATSDLGAASAKLTEELERRYRGRRGAPPGNGGPARD